MGIYTRNKTPYERRTLQDMLVPYLMYTQRYDDIANKLGELGDQSVIWNNLLSPTRDPETWSTVNDYNQRLGDTIYDMQRGNLNLNDALGQLQNMRREYNSWGTAVDNAYKQRQKFVEEQRALALQPGGYHVTRPAESISIDELINNPAASYEALSEKELYDRGKAAATASSNRRYSTYETTRFKNEYNVLVNQKGYSQKDAAKFLADKYNIPELGQIFNNLSTEYNLDRFGNDSSIDRIQLDQSIFNGILDGMTGSLTETNFGKITENTFPGFGGNNGKSSKVPMPTIPLSHITQGYNEPKGDVVTDNAWMDNGKVYNERRVELEEKYKSIQEEYEDYLNAIRNTETRIPYYPSAVGEEQHRKEVESKGWRVENGYQVRSKVNDFFDNNGNYIGNKSNDSFTYNGKKYSPKRFDELQKIVDDYKVSDEPLQEVYNQYSYLNNTNGINMDLSYANVINIGNELNNSIIQPKIVDYPFKIKPSQAKDVITFYNTALSDEDYYPNRNESSNGIFQIQSDGSLSKRLTNTPNASDKAIVIAKDSGNGLEIGFRQNGHDYAWRGDAELDQVRSEYNGMKSWLQDFTNTGVGINNENGTIYIANTKDDKDDIYSQINGKKGVSIPGTPYYGYVIYDQESRDLVKIIADTPIFILPQYTYDPMTNQYGISYGSHVIAKNTMGSQRSGNSKYMNDDLNQYIKMALSRTNTWFSSETE